MAELGFDSFAVAGHDRGGRVAHRMALDFPARVLKLAVLDIVPTAKLFASTNQALATGYYHWFFLIQPGGLPERLIGADPDYYLREKLKRWSADFSAFTAQALECYQQAFRDPEMIHATCEDYRAAATIDLVHDAADAERQITCALLVLWGEAGLMGRQFDVLATWQERALEARGKGLACGHFLAEEKPQETYHELHRFFTAS